ncbi:MAG: S8 family serine peptidase, partial [Firmicutes bacterium]|nr:S8 family serine peptidase [Bacillota bacterium]
MKQSKIYRKLLSVALAAVMVLSLTNGLSVGKARAQENGGYRLTWEEVENNGKGLLYGRDKTQAAFEENYVKDGMVRVSILLDGDATLKKFPAKNIASNAAAASYRAGLRAKQDEMAQTISRKVLNGEKLDVVWNITLAANIISANIPYEKLDAVRNIIGVKDVVLETRYEALVASKDENDPNMSTASEMVGGNYAWAAGYTGAGSKIAIVDTGLDLEHQSFNGAALEESLQGKTVDLLEAAEVASVFSSLNAAKFLSAADGIYRNTKVPYGVNYVDKGLDVTHMGDRQGEHGSHVAGIAAANSLIPDGNGGFKKALDTVKTQGEAPDAQLLIMKVFGKGGGASDSDYMVAIEDAIILGADAVNLSLGSGNPGLVTNNTYNRILTEVAEATNLVWCNSAGNSYNWAQYSSQGYLYDDDVSFATGGSPATYGPTFSVASVNNKGTTAYSFEAEGVTAYYSDTRGYSNEPLISVPGEYEFILLDGPGVDDNDHVGQAGDDFFALGSEVVAGKIAMCYRGTSSFFAKANAAVEQGAVATVIINNQAGVINMNMTGYEYSAPAVSILQADGNAIKAAARKVESANDTYYTGKITISDLISVYNPGDDFTYEMSDFSSWGVPGDLSLKPEITTPGGNIYSIFGHSYSSTGVEQGGPDQYENMSGTSMASPQMAGLVAVFAQYIRENDLTTKTGRSARQLALSLLMSTAEPMLDADGEYFPVIQQGSGLANVNNALNAKSYITIDGVAAAAPRSAASAISEGKVKVELGEVKDDSFTTTFTLHNFSDEKVEYDLNAEFFTQYIYERYHYRTGWIDYLDLAYEWTVNGEAYEPSDILYDFNGDHVVNGRDAQHLLDYCAGLVEDSKLFNAEYADLDEDEDIDTYDARLAFELLNTASIAVDSKDVTVTLTVSGLSNAIKSINGNFIEGYIFAKESDSEDGALGVVHS